MPRTLSGELSFLGCESTLIESAVPLREPKMISRVAIELRPLARLDYYILERVVPFKLALVNL